MPYITQEQRWDLDGGDAPTGPGELNYLITHLCIKYLKFQQPSYKTINEIIGALECAKQEFYRRVAVPYEEQKKFDNGDVYE